jgi:O-acetyl-ADP-ribose deacetylase (regulator of RNase III)
VALRNRKGPLVTYNPLPESPTLQAAKIPPAPAGGTVAQSADTQIDEHETPVSRRSDSATASPTGTTPPTQDAETAEGSKHAMSPQSAQHRQAQAEAAQAARHRAELVTAKLAEAARKADGARTEHTAAGVEHRTATEMQARLDAEAELVIAKRQHEEAAAAQAQAAASQAQLKAATAREMARQQAVRSQQEEAAEAQAQAQTQAQAQMQAQVQAQVQAQLQAQAQAQAIAQAQAQAQRLEAQKLSSRIQEQARKRQEQTVQAREEKDATRRAEDTAQHAARRRQLQARAAKLCMACQKQPCVCADIQQVLVDKLAAARKASQALEATMAAEYMANGAQARVRNRMREAANERLGTRLEAEEPPSPPDTAPEAITPMSQRDQNGEAGQQPAAPHRCRLTAKCVTHLRAPDRWLGLPGATLHVAFGSILEFAWKCGWNPMVTAIVNAANTGGITGGGVDAAITAAGGRLLADDRFRLPILSGTANDRIATGDATVTGPNDYGTLVGKYVIHAVGPNYSVLEASGLSAEDGDQLLYSAYQRSMQTAERVGIKYLGYPLLSAGAFRGVRPLKMVIQIALKAIADNVYEGLLEVHLVTLDRSVWTLLQSTQAPTWWDGTAKARARSDAAAAAAPPLPQRGLRVGQRRRSKGGNTRAASDLPAATQLRGHKRNTAVAAQSNSRGGLARLADRPHDSLSPLKPPRKKAGREVHFEDEAQEEDSQDKVQPLTVTYLESLSAKDRFHGGSRQGQNNR